MKKKNSVINFLAVLLVCVTIISFAFDSFSNSDLKINIKNVISETKDKIYKSLSIDDRKTNIENMITETKESIYEILSNSELKIKSNIKNLLFETKEKINEILAKLDFAKDKNNTKIISPIETKVQEHDLNSEKSVVELDSIKNVYEKNETLVEIEFTKKDLYTKTNDDVVEQNLSEKTTNVIEDTNTTQKEEVTLVIDKTKVEPIIQISEIDNKDKDSFKTKFLSSNNKYTINIATVANMKESKKFTKENSIEDNSFAFIMGKKKRYVKILYGIYDTSMDAKKGMSTLSSRLLRNSPTIQKINKNQKLYYKYNEDLDSFVKEEK